MEGGGGNRFYNITERTLHNLILLQQITTKTCTQSVLHQNIVKNNCKLRRQCKDLVKIPITAQFWAVGRCCDVGAIVLPGGGADGDVPFFGVSFSLIFPGTGYQKKSIFLEPVE